MPRCKNCGARLTKFDNDICPVCGTAKPLEGVSSETVEITTSLDINDIEFKKYKPATKFKTMLFFLLVGWSGAGFFYLNFIPLALVWSFLNIFVLEAGLGSIFTFAVGLAPITGFMIPVAIIYFINIIAGLYFLLKHNVKDGHGEFLR